MKGTRNVIVIKKWNAACVSLVVIAAAGCGGNGGKKHHDPDADAEDILTSIDTLGVDSPYAAGLTQAELDTVVNWPQLP